MFAALLFVFATAAHAPTSVRLKPHTPLVGLQADPPDARLQQTGTQANQPEIITDVRVHGNVLTPDAEVRRIAGLEIGSVFGPETLANAEMRLTASKRFERVEVLKRFASIADPSRILLIIIVDEGPVRIERTSDPDQPVRVVRSRRSRLMVAPLVDIEDGYGISYGAQLALPQIAGDHSRLAFPLTWGGTKRAAAELSKEFSHAPISRAEAGFALSQRTNPFFREDDDRARLWVRAERRLAQPLRVGSTFEWQRVSFLDRRDSFAAIGADIVWDNRLDPVLARNAVYARAAWARLAVPGGGVARTTADVRVYVGLIGQTVLVARAEHESADAALPPYLQPLLGGTANVRGFRAGSAAGDELAAGSLELRVPLTSPLSIGKIGVSGFVDIASVYASNEGIGDRPFAKGVGGSLWFSAAFLHFSLAVAHGIGAGTRVHVGTSTTF